MRLDIWTEVEKLKGQTLRTLDQRKPFTVVVVNATALVLRPSSTNRERAIPRKHIEAAMRQLQAAGELDAFEIDMDYAPRNAIYVAAIFATLPGVEYSLRPIYLWTTE